MVSQEKSPKLFFPQNNSCFSNLMNVKGNLILQSERKMLNHRNRVCSIPWRIICGFGPQIIKRIFRMQFNKVIVLWRISRFLAYSVWKALEPKGKCKCTKEFFPTIEYRLISLESRILEISFQATLIPLNVKVQLNRSVVIVTAANLFWMLLANRV